MKQGISIGQLMSTVERQNLSKRDFIGSTASMYMGGNGTLCMETGDQPLNLTLTAQAHLQIAERLGIPRRYYERMRSESPALLAENVNHWFAVNPENRMVRTLDSNARAFLSDRYHRIDNFDILQAVLPVLDQLGLAKNIVSCELSENRMYLKVINPRVEAEVRKDDIVQSGFVLSNSETGQGSTNVLPLVYRLVCTNGLILPEHGQRKIHLGRQIETTSETAMQLFSEKTLSLEREVYLRKVVDVIRGISNPTIFDRIVNTMRDAAEQKITIGPKKAVEMVAERIKLSEQEFDGALNHLILSSDFSKYGMMNAVTRTAQDSESYERATQLEALGYDVLNMPRTAWEAIATAV